MDKNLAELIYEIKLLKSNKNGTSNIIDTKYNQNNFTSKVKKALLDIENNRNHSWAIEMFDRNKNNLDSIALKYRGNKISYREMFTKAYAYAKSLKQMGFEKNSEIPICITNIPEFIYLFLASSFIGAKVNIVSDWFAEDYLIDIFNKSKSRTIFIDDISYPLIKSAINKSSIENIVCFSLTDSLKNGINPYQSIDNLFHEFSNNVNGIRNDFNGEFFDVFQFLEFGKKYSGVVIADMELDDVCSITYTSGTTKPGYPKGVIQSNRSYITLSRFKESDVSGMPTMKNISVLAHIPTDTHMELSCAISDTFYCGCELDLEPFYSNEWFPYSLIINKPNFVPASAGFWGTLCKKLAFDPIFENINMPYLMIPTVTGEGLSEGEEKFFNQTSRKHKFGVDKLPFPLSPVTFSIGGGTTESSGIFVTLYKSLQEKKLNHLIKKHSLGLTPHKFADVAVLDENGNHCEINQPGLLVANSPCEMIGYTDEELNKNVHVIDSYGKRWLSLGTYSYIDVTGRVKMKGRMGSYVTLSNGAKIPYYSIEDIILLDTKNVMSCSVVDTNEGALICHIELQPFKQKSEEECYKGIIGRIESSISEEIKEKLFIRLRNNVESFPLDPSGKRSLSTLKKIGIDEKTISYMEFKNSIEKGNEKILKLK